jgi:transposase
LALVVLSVVEQRLDAVRAVLDGATVIEVAVAAGVSRSTLHRWIGRYLAGTVAGLADRSHRPVSCPHQASPQVEVLVAELRRKHPRWGSKRIRMQLLRAPVEGIVVPSERTISRILLRHGLAQPRPRKRPKASYVRFERPGPMQLSVDIVGGLWLVDPVTGVLREAKIVTGVDDHSRYCVMAKVVERATSRAVCVAFAEALARFGGARGNSVRQWETVHRPLRQGWGGDVRPDLPQERHPAPADRPVLAEPERQGGEVPRHPAT